MDAVKDFLQLVMSEAWLYNAFGTAVSSLLSAFKAGQGRVLSVSFGLFSVLRADRIFDGFRGFVHVGGVSNFCGLSMPFCAFHISILRL